MLDANEQVPELEKLDREEYVINIESRDIQLKKNQEEVRFGQGCGVHVASQLPWSQVLAYLVYAGRPPASVPRSRATIWARTS